MVKWIDIMAANEAEDGAGPSSVSGRGCRFSEHLRLHLACAELACAESYEFLGIAIVAPPPKFTIEFRHS